MSTEEINKREYALFMATRQMHSDLFNEAYTGPWDDSRQTESGTDVLGTIATKYFKRQFNFDFNKTGSHAPRQFGDVLLRYTRVIYISDFDVSKANIVADAFVEENASGIIPVNLIPQMRNAMVERLLQYAGATNVEDWVWKVSSEVKTYALERPSILSTKEYTVCVHARSQEVTDAGSGRTYRLSYMYYIGYYCNQMPPRLPLEIHDNSTSDRDSQQAPEVAGDEVNT